MKPLSSVLLRSWPFVVPPLALACISTFCILRLTGGAPSVPLDDAYIHFQFARSFARFEPLVYVPGGSPVAGASSLLWPGLLAPAWLLGFDGLNVIWLAWLYGWVSFALLGYETWRVAKGFLSDAGAFLALALVYGFSGLVWYAASGMEVIPLAWILMRTARRGAEWWESEQRPSGSERAEILALSFIAPLLRPEGVIASVAILAALALKPRGGKRAWAFVALCGACSPMLLNAWIAGRGTTTTAEVKWLALNPYYGTAAFCERVFAQVRLLFGTLLNGEIWSDGFVPTGGAPVAWCALPALLVLGVVARKLPRAVILCWFGATVLIVTSYDSFLVNRLRYLWPFAAPWLIGVVAIVELVGAALGRLSPKLAVAKWVLGGAAFVAVAAQLPFAIEDLAVSADAIRRQQVALGFWARDHLPRAALIGVNDAGAIAYLSGHPTFDVVGLTTATEGKYWVMGAGSRFEHYERLGAARLPSHFIVYPEWFGLDPLLGRFLTERSVPNATILGGPTMMASEARYDVLGSGERPERAPEGALLDELDVADLESEHAHEYALFDATQATNRLVWNGERADGGRVDRARERFLLTLAGGGTLVLRLGSVGSLPVQIRLWAEDSEHPEAEHTLTLAGSAWEELSWRVPERLPARRWHVSLTTEHGTFSALHYWSYSPVSPPNRPKTQ